MALVRDKDGKRLHVKSKLMGESLVSKAFIDQLDIAPQERLYPDVAVMKIGGQSICDRGVKALPAILKEIVANREKDKILITTGGGKDVPQRYRQIAHLFCRGHHSGYARHAAL